MVLNDITLKSATLSSSDKKLMGKTERTGLHDNSIAAKGIRAYFHLIPTSQATSTITSTARKTGKPSVISGSQAFSLGSTLPPHADTTSSTATTTVMVSSSTLMVFFPILRPFI